MGVLLHLACCGSQTFGENVCVGASEADNYFDLITESDMDRIRNARILFGHKSIGMNVLYGMSLLGPDYSLSIDELTAPFDASDFAVPRLGHFYFSTTAKYLKIGEFDETVRDAFSRSVDIAFYKFCYPDTCGPDYETFFAEYAASLDALRAEYPNIEFVAWTGPLSTGTDTYNARRNWYNNLLKEKYEGVIPIFDLADIESTRPSGEVCTFEYGGETLRRMWPEYSSDSNHPNQEEIEIRLGKGLLVLLQQVVSEKAAVEGWEEFVR
jgi:hypothetical protein